ncbi:MAG: 5'-nucleotidase [Legionellaceae bacterium]|nr:5'-nucleotidase [Legionellaceae bacterium]HAF86970.1 5'-nucleotidase [Legionellales bacterium]HCA89537.1 5'-nucleotidase [Legionellales bacterium]
MMHQQVFVNRILNMKKIRFIGFDMDHTLIRYHTQNFEELVYTIVVDKLITTKHYPECIRRFTFDFNAAIRGLIIDSKNGNILKLSRYGAIRQSYHGTQLIDYSEQQQIYRSIYVDLKDPNYMAIDTSFSIAFCVLYAQLIDLKDKKTAMMPSYAEIALDVLGCVDKAHSDGSIKNPISQNLSRYIVKDPQVVEGLKRLRHYGKQLFILTNSDYAYTQLLLDYALTPFMDNAHWSSLFTYVITLANKPRFFYDTMRFLSINPQTACMSNATSTLSPGIYQGGNAQQFSDYLNLKGDDILYIGDHIYGDILRLKKDCNWRTALVVEELEEEIQAQAKSAELETQISQAMLEKQTLEETYLTLCTERIEYFAENEEQTHIIQQKINQLDERIADKLQQQTYFNAQWGRIFRTGAEESYFAYQVDRFACIYMTKLTDLLSHSPLTYFRAKKRTLAHD